MRTIVTLLLPVVFGALVSAAPERATGFKIVEATIAVTSDEMKTPISPTFNIRTSQMFSVSAMTSRMIETDEYIIDF